MRYKNYNFKTFIENKIMEKTQTLPLNVLNQNEAKSQIVKCSRWNHSCTRSLANLVRDQA